MKKTKVYTETSEKAPDAYIGKYKIIERIEGEGSERSIK